MVRFVPSNTQYGSIPDKIPSLSNQSGSIRTYVITGVAIIGITLTTAAILGLAATNLNLYGLGALSHLPSQIYYLSGIGGLTFLLISYAVSSNKTHEESNSSFQKEEAISKPSYIELDASDEVELSNESNKLPSKKDNVNSVTARQIDQYELFPESFHESAKKILLDLNIANLDSHLKSIYTENKPVSIKLIIEGSVPRTDLFEEQLKILLSTDARLLEHKLESINNLSDWSIALIHYRLHLIEENEFSDSPPRSTWKDFSEDITLGKFRMIAADELLKHPAFIKTEVLRFASPIQIVNLLQTEQTPELLNVLLPLNSTFATKRSTLILKYLPMPSLTTNFDSFSREHLAIFSKEQFKNTSFPWDLVVSSKEKIEELFPLDETGSNETKERIQSLPIEVIQILFPALTASHLRLLSDQQLQDTNFPWKELIQSQEKVEEFFSLKTPDEKVKTTNILQILDQTIVEILKPFLSMDHLRLLSSEQLQDQDSTWKELAQSKEKVEEFFPLENPHGYETRLYLQKLSISALKILIPALSGERLRMLSKEQLQHPDFPWKELIKSEEKIKTLFSLEFKKWGGTIQLIRLLNIDAIKILFPFLSYEHIWLLTDEQLQSPDFPWKELAQSEEKASLFFSLEGQYSHKMVTRILKIVNQNTIELFKDYLTEEHLKIRESAL